MPSPNSPDPLDRLLDSWRDPTAPLPSLAPEVWRRVARAESDGETRSWWRAAVARFTRPAAALCFVASCVLLGLFLAEARAVREERAQSARLVRSYLELVDPLIPPAAGAPPAATLDDELGWMKSELHLTPAQFDRIRRLHQENGPELKELAAAVAQLRAEFTAFEATRRATDRVDFLEFADFVQQRRRIDRQCRAVTTRLLLAAARDMTPAQRARYLALVAPAGPSRSAAN